MTIRWCIKSLMYKDLKWTLYKVCQDSFQNLWNYSEPNYLFQLRLCQWTKSHIREKYAHHHAAFCCSLVQVSLPIHLGLPNWNGGMQGLPLSGTEPLLKNTNKRSTRMSQFKNRTKPNKIVRRRTVYQPLYMASSPDLLALQLINSANQATARETSIRRWTI